MNWKPRRADPSVEQAQGFEDGLPLKTFVGMSPRAPQNRAVRAFMTRPRGARIRMDYQTMTKGTVKFFNTTKGFGFITPDNGEKDVFVHVTAVHASGMDTLSDGQTVEFDIEPDRRGPKAVNLRAA